MYLIGADSKCKMTAQRIVEQCIANDDQMVTDVEVFQEILHRYVAIDRKEFIQPAFNVLLGLVDEVLPVGVQDIHIAKDMVLAARHRISARDALHAAIMKQHGVTQIVSFDADYDKFDFCTRISS